MKVQLKAKIDVIPNTREARVRNLLSHLPSRLPGGMTEEQGSPALLETRKSSALRKRRSGKKHRSRKSIAQA
jgi:hypothetical protein